MDSCTFSLLMAVYGGDDPAALDEALGSVAALNGPSPPVILVVDGPISDLLEHVLQRWSSLLDLHLHRLPSNVGLARALNHGLRHVPTEWVARFDADDLLLPNRFLLQLEWINATGASVCSGHIEEFDGETGALLGLRLVPEDEREIRRLLPFRSPFNHVAAMYRRDDVLAVGGYPNVPLKEDYALWATLLAQGLRAGNVPAVLVRVRAGKNMIRRRRSWSAVKSEYLLQRLLLKLRLTSPWSAAPVGLLRCLPAVVPGWVVSLLYRWALRSQPTAASQGSDPKGGGAPYGMTPKSPQKLE
jgi:glycosyltransferase involved in cell wall biosynthesis